LPIGSTCMSAKSSALIVSFQQNYECGISVWLIW
jgi:hypothetical protein